MRRPYTVITKKIIEFKGNSKLLDIYTYACLYNSIDYKTGISKISQAKIAHKFRIPERTFRDSIKRLSNPEGNNILQVKRTVYSTGTEVEKKNYYYMNTNPENYFFIYDEFLTLDIDNKIKGFILLLKAICLSNTNTYLAKKPFKGKINITEIAELMNITTKTLNNYLKLAIDLELIQIIEDKIIIITEHIPLRVKESNRQSEIVKTIQDLCNKNKSEMPFISNEDLMRIECYYPFHESQIKEINQDDFTKIHSFKYVLNNRLKTLPKTFTIKYIFETLKLPYKENKEPIERKDIIII